MAIPEMSRQRWAIVELIPVASYNQVEIFI
jgi:hypothetical protein